MCVDVSMDKEDSVSESNCERKADINKASDEKKFS